MGGSGGFASASGGTGGAGVGGGNGGSTTGGVGGGSVTTGSGPQAPTSVIPKVTFVGPPCVRGTNCSVSFVLDQAYASPVDFDWKTNDALYGTAVPSGQPPWGKPNYAYVPASGHITFAPGELSRQVYVQNINPDNVAISIGILMSNCMYASMAYNCTTFFQ